MSSAFESPNKGPARSPTQPREPSQGLRGARSWTCLRFIPRLFICSGPWAQGASGPPDSRPWTGCGMGGGSWGEWVENQGECPPTQSRGVRGCSGWVPLFPFVPPLSFSVVILRPREGQPLPQGHTAQGRPLGAHCSPLPRGFLLMGHLWCQGPLLGDHWPLWMQMPGRTRCSPAC